MAVIIFAIFVAFVLALSFYLGSKAKSASGYFAAGGQIHWAVNGIAFAGDYLSAASFLGICGMIAFMGYDGFLYSIGYLAGWIVALFVVAEPMKRLGKYTFTDALDCNFNSRGIQLAAGISTLIVSVCYLIPQMVGAGVLVEPLLRLDHHWGVIMVGAIVIFIVATAGMASTTYVQFLKGSLLIVFSTILTIAMCSRGLTTTPKETTEVNRKVVTYPFYNYKTLKAVEQESGLSIADTSMGKKFSFEEQNAFTDAKTGKVKLVFVKLSHKVPVKQENGSYSIHIKGRNIPLAKDGKKMIESLLQADEEELVKMGGNLYTHKEINGEKVLVLYEGKSAVIDGLKIVEEDGSLYARIRDWWKKEVTEDGSVLLHETQSKTLRPNGGIMVNGAPISETNSLRLMGSLEAVRGKTGEAGNTGGVGPAEFLAALSDKDTVVNRPKKFQFKDGDNLITVFHIIPTAGNKFVRPGLKFKVEGSGMDRLNFVSLMLALFCGTAALPHILIRYYTVPSPAAARKSTIVAIASIGFFYILTMYLGMGALVNGALNPETSNMSAPLLARAFSEFLFAVISAIAFATVLGTVSGLIVASSGAVAHDLLDRYCNLNMTEKTKVLVGKLAAFAVGLVAIILGIVFRGMNVSFLVGWAFAVAASANLPAIVMLLFWKKTTAKGIIASIVVGIVAAIGIILLSPDMYVRYGKMASEAPLTLAQPGVVSIPLSFITLVIVSLLTQKKGETAQATPAAEI